MRTAIVLAILWTGIGLALNAIYLLAIRIKASIHKIKVNIIIDAKGFLRACWHWPEAIRKYRKTLRLVRDILNERRFSRS